MTIHFFVQLIWLHLLGSAVESFTVTKDGVVGKAAILTGPAHIGVPAACFQRVDPGPCGRDIIRVFYDHKTYTCKAFSYSGCGGNMNRFVSVKNCYKLCHPYYRQRPADIMDAGTTTEGGSTTAEPTTTAEPSTTPEGSSTAETMVVVPMRPRPMPAGPPPEVELVQVQQVHVQGPSSVGAIQIQSQRPQPTGFVPMGIMPMTSGARYSQPYQRYQPYQQNQWYGKRK